MNEKSPIVKLHIGCEFPAIKVDVTREMIREYAHASADYNPLHLDEEWMASVEFGATRFGKVIAHGLMTYSFATRAITDVVYPLGGWHERHESRFRAPVYPGDTLTTHVCVTHLRPLDHQILYAANVYVDNQDGVTVITGDAMGRVPPTAVDADAIEEE